MNNLLFHRKSHFICKSTEGVNSRMSNHTGEQAATTIKNIVTSKKPTAIAKQIWHKLLTKSIPLPLNKFTKCPTPKVTLEIIIADFRLSFAIALNRNPLKITSSINPTQSIQAIRQTVPDRESLTAMPFQRFPVAKIKSGT